MQRGGDPDGTVESGADVRLGTGGAVHARQSRPEMPPQAHLQTDGVGDAGPERAGLGGGLVDRDPGADAVADPADGVQAVGGLRTSSRPTGAIVSIAGLLLDLPGAVGVEAQGPLGADCRTHRRCAGGVVADPDLELYAPEPFADRLGGRVDGSGAVAVAIVALTATARAGSSLSSSATGLPTRRPCCSESAMSIAASACGVSSARRQASSRLAPPISPAPARVCR